MSDNVLDEYESLELNSESHDSKLIPQPQQYVQEDLEDIIRQQPIFFEQEIQSGNFNLLVLHTPENLDELDSTGYALIHHAISFERQDIIKYLLVKGANPLNKSQIEQSCLMMACHFGNQELVQLFIELGNKINDQDNLQFTPLLYATKCNHHLIALYLIALQANTDVKDNAGCTIMHWAAYTNDVYMLKYFEGDKSYNQQDSKGKTPLIRAISNYSNDAVEYLLRTYPDIMPNKEIDLKTQAIKKIVETVKYQQFIKKHNTRFVQYSFIGVVYFIIGVLVVNNFWRLQNDDVYGYSISLISLILTLYSLFYCIIFISKTTSRQEEGKKISKGLGHPKISYECHHHGDGEHRHHILEEEINLGENQDDVEYGNSQNLSELLRAVKLHFEKDEQFLTFEITRTCPKCKIVQKAQVYHCDHCNLCVKGFQFHSIYLNKCINNTNHFFYVILLLSYFITFVINVYTAFYTLSNNNFSITLFYFLPLFSNISIVEQIAYYGMIFGIYITSINLIVQVVCVFCNMTEHELLNTEQYKYLYELILINGFYYMKLRKVGDIFENVKSYIWNQYSELRIL
ncbi:unnamed protein product (macronuclear) [Paramecium tetraurelia]|uniref:Palmitoyltransferase n=1 Tax=Paramecium tetraurelia TaxID=5888 RepID=A0DSZ9_PARTE|nr:uncharacterized protein GSPATT00019859001 [Paramecium tetraurelia]CAK86166.1 unnamed protein product [Paramecium tetraurelia]|eukprot:XP_001453563.1 hypothetical protein (macronuclear) [Paramecium tetraurelia strain d4-2]